MTHRLGYLGRWSTLFLRNSAHPLPNRRFSTFLPPSSLWANTRQPRNLRQLAAPFARSASMAAAQPTTNQAAVAPVGPASKSYGNFDLVQRLKLDYADIALEKWTSRETGLSVVHLDYDSPLVKGYFVVATEIFNDSGCPHTLEHLVFLGSEQYPYKGVLDNLANRAFSEGTNAWTGTDQTAYTIATAGQQGFLQLLPIYVDHILYPTITDSGFVTEVHHINGKAEDAGVVYAEMQGREQTSGDLMGLKMQRAFYPPTSAYRSETGGLMEALRVLTAEQIREYHRSYYVPHNLCLIVAGKLSTSALLDVLQTKVEPSILKHGQKGAPEGWKRPFMETSSAQTPNIQQPIKETVEFPEKDESMSELTMAHVGPDPHDLLTRKAIDILGKYLTDSPVAPLNKEFVEIPSPLCTYISFIEIVRPAFVSCDVYFGSVPTNQLESFDGKFKDALKRIASESVDMDRMRVILKRDRLGLLNALEASGGDHFYEAVIDDFLYGPRDGSGLKHALRYMDHYKQLSEWSSDQWTALLAKYYIDRPAVTVRGKPSATLPDKLESDEKARISAQRESLGEEGLAKLAKELEEAKKEHERPIPKEMLTSFPLPDVGSISWIPVQSAKNDPEKGLVSSAKDTSSDTLQKHLAKDDADVPFFVSYHNVKSAFVTVNAFLSTADLPAELRPYMSVYMASFFSNPVTLPDGTKLSHEEVVNKLDDGTVGYDSSLGSMNYFNELLQLSIRVESGQYASAITWLRDLMYSSEFTKERLEVNIAKIQQGLPELKRDGHTVCSAVSNGLIFDEHLSTNQALAVTIQMDFIPKLAKEIQEDTEGVIKKFEQIREILTDPKALRFGVNGNVLGLEKPRSAWLDFKKLPRTTLPPVPTAKDCLTTLGKNPVKKAVVVTLPTIESSFATHSTKTISGFSHPEYPALRLACEVLDGTESYLWRYIRGTGLAYGANMELDLEAGILGFSVYRSPDSVKAYGEALKVVKGLTDGSISMEDTVLDGAKSSLVYSLTKSVSSPGRAAAVSFSNEVLKDLPGNYSPELLAKFQAVTIDDVKNALRTHVLPLFDPASSVAVVVSAPGKAGDIAAELTRAGFEVESRTLDVGAEDGESDEDGSSGSESEDQR